MARSATRGPSIEDGFLSLPVVTPGSGLELGLAGVKVSPPRVAAPDSAVWMLGIEDVATAAGVALGWTFDGVGNAGEATEGLPLSTPVATVGSPARTAEAGLSGCWLR